MSKDLEHSLMELIYFAGNFQKQPRSLEGCGLFTQSEIKVLMAVQPLKKTPMTKIAEILGTTKGGATQLVNGLVNRKILKREYDKEDRRIIYISYTHTGERAHKSYLECKNKILRTICKDITVNITKENLINCIQAVTSALKKCS